MHLDYKKSLQVFLLNGGYDDIEFHYFSFDQWWYNGGAPTTHVSAGDPPTIAGSSGSVSHWVTSPFLWVLVCARFCLGPPGLESLFPPVLWKSYNHILLAFKARFPGDPQSLCHVPRLGGLMGVQDLHNSGRTSLVLLFSSLWVIHSVGVGFDFIMIVPFLPSHFAFWSGASLLAVFQHPPADSCSTAIGNFHALTGDEHMSFYSATLNQKPNNFWSMNYWILFHFLGNENDQHWK